MISILNFKFLKIYVHSSLFFNILLASCIQPNQNEVINKVNNVDSNTTYIKSTKEETCIIADRINKLVLSYINEKDSNIYNYQFTELLKKNAIEKYSCRFPRNKNENDLFYFLIDSIIPQRSNKDIRAIKLSIDIYRINRNNAELSEVSGEVNAKIATLNTLKFIKILSNYREIELERCLGIFDYLESSDLIYFRQNIDKITNKEYSNVINKIKYEILDNN